jgi:hypothetical protein
MRRRQPRNPATFLIYQDGRIHSPHGASQFTNQRNDLRGILYIPPEQNEPIGIGHSKK